MCGIAGKVYLDGRKVTKTDVLLMTRAIKHRGPDDEGVVVENNVGLGNRRLSILDLSSAGHMPMSYGRAQQLVITYNGEVYNFAREREKLRKRGYRFRTGTDTEVVLALYKEYGFKFLDHLRGMFALAIWDREKQLLFLARDRIGKKPLKFFFDGNCFLFASELKAILTQKEVKREPDWLAIFHFLSYGYVPSPQTGFEGIAKLEPGHYLVLDLKRKTLVNKEYWKPDYSHKDQLSTKEWSEKIIKVLDEAVRLRMVADVPVGVFLSGGIDSSSVVAMMSRNSSRPIKTFTVGFREKTMDESAYAELVAKRFQTDHTQIVIDPEAVDILPQLVKQYEEPFADASSLVTYLVSKAAAKHVKVILNGDGGDENFAGYGRYGKIKFYDQLNKWQVLKNPSFQNSLGKIADLSGSSGIGRIYRIVKKLNDDETEKLIVWNQYFSREEKVAICKGDLKALLDEHRSVEVYKRMVEPEKLRNNLERALYGDLRIYLPDDLLVKVDIASMAVGLEARSPLLDQKLVELAAKIPGSLKFVGGNNYKYIFKQALRGILPEEIIRRSKMGFSVPIYQWFKGDLKKYAGSVLLDKNAFISNIIKKGAIREMLVSHGRDELDFGPRLWTLLTLELWWKSYFG